MKVFIHVVDITYFEEVPYVAPYTELHSDYDVFHVTAKELTHDQTLDLLESWFKRNTFGLKWFDVMMAANDLLFSNDVEYVSYDGLQCRLSYHYFEEEVLS